MAFLRILTGFLNVPGDQKRWVAKSRYDYRTDRFLVDRVVFEMCLYEVWTDNLQPNHWNITYFV